MYTRNSYVVKKERAVAGARIFVTYYYYYYYYSPK